MTIDVTIDDAGAYTDSWSASHVVHLRPGWEPLEFICGENNKDIESLPGDNIIISNYEAAVEKGFVAD